MHDAASIKIRDHDANERKLAAAKRAVAALRNITECAEAGEGGANMDLWIEQARAAIAEAEAAGIVP